MVQYAKLILDQKFQFLCAS